MQGGAAAGPIYVYPDGDVLEADRLSEWACPAVPAALHAAAGWEEGGASRSVRGFRFDGDAFQASLQVPAPACACLLLLSRAILT